VEIVAIEVTRNAPIIGKTLAESKLRQDYKITLVALKRDHKVIDHPKPTLSFCEGDVAYILGKTEHISKAGELFAE
jgi:K+/H+ antiporter YhaU regulatory subunit KhtT